MDLKNYISRIQDIIDITKIQIYLVIKNDYFSKLPLQLDETIKDKLAILATNDLFGEDTDPTKNDIRETSPELAEREIEPLKQFILREGRTFLNNVIRLKAFAISKGVSEIHGTAFLKSVQKDFLYTGNIPSEEEVSSLIDEWDKLISNFK